MDEFNFQPILFGLTSKELWNPMNILPMPAWILLAVVPRWKYTMVITLMPPIVSAAIYLWSFKWVMRTHFQDNNKDDTNLLSFDNIYQAFQNPDFLFVGWIHYVCFDLLIARGIVMDAISFVGISDLIYYITMIPCLFFSMMLGPVGFLLYVTIIRPFFMFRTSSSTTAASSGTTKKVT